MPEGPGRHGVGTSHFVCFFGSQCPATYELLLKIFPDCILQNNKPHKMGRWCKKHPAKKMQNGSGEHEDGRMDSS